MARDHLPHCGPDELSSVQISMTGGSDSPSSRQCPVLVGEARCDAQADQQENRPEGYRKTDPEHVAQGEYMMKKMIVKGRSISDVARLPPNSSRPTSSC